MVIMIPIIMLMIITIEWIILLVIIDITILFPIFRQIKWILQIIYIIVFPLIMTIKNSWKIIWIDITTVETIILTMTTYQKKERCTLLHLLILTAEEEISI